MTKVINDVKFYQFLRNKFYLSCLGHNAEEQQVMKRRSKRRNDCVFFDNTISPKGLILPKMKHKPNKGGVIKSKLDTIPK